MIRLLARDATYYSLRVVGFVLLGLFLLYAADWRFSALAASAYVGISFAVSYLIAALRLGERWPALNRYLFPANYKHDGELPEGEWALRQAEYLESGFRRNNIFFTVSEDGLVCVPVAFSGISLLSSTVGGVAFGILHLGRFTYLECIGKSIIYGFVCYFVLPTGILSVVIGHLANDAIGFVLLKLIKRKLKKAEA